MLVGEYLVVGDAEGYLYWIQRADGALAGHTRLTKAPIAATPVSLGDTVYARANNGTIGAYTLSIP